MMMLRIPQRRHCLLTVVVVAYCCCCYLLGVVVVSAQQEEHEQQYDAQSPKQQQAPQPVCSSSEVMDGSCIEEPPSMSSTKESEENDNNTNTNNKKKKCSLWWYDYWVIAGQDYPINSTIGTWGTRTTGDDDHDDNNYMGDVVIPFQQHERRAFPMFNRFYYLYQIPNQPYHYLFTPFINYPFECHDTLYNIRQTDVNELLSSTTTTSSSKTSPPLRSLISVKEGDPLYLPCRHEDHATSDEIDQFPNYYQDVLQKGVCLDGLRTDKSTLPNVELGAFATQDYSVGQVVTEGPVLHMHRSEFYNKKTHIYEELINYCLGHSKTDLLLLPLIPVVNSMNHHDDLLNRVNIEIRTSLNPQQLSMMFSKPTEIAFGENEYTTMDIQYIAMKEIKEGDELFLHYGTEWTNAYKKYQTTTAQAMTTAATNNNKQEQPQQPFRHEIHVSNIFPQRWLDREIRDKPFPEFHLKKLQPGEVSPALLTTGEQIGHHLHRVGFPKGFTTKMRQFADETGVTQIMKDIIVGTKTLPKEGERRVRINGGTWWIKRFDSSWASNMHYIAPDDDISNEQYMHALGEAGYDEVIAGIGQYFNLSRLSLFYPSYIAVSHAQFSYMHSDSDYDKVWNMIFPVIQVNDTSAEINLGSNDDFTTDLFNVPYRYEPDHGTLLGLDGMHGTAPTDYRGIEGDVKFRLVASVYMGAFDDTFVDEYVNEWADPPYPLRHNLRNSLMYRTHWSATDKTKKCTSPQVNDFTQYNNKNNNRNSRPTTTSQQQQQQQYVDERYYHIKKKG